MPWYLVPPRQGKTPYFYIRGKYCGIRLDRSTGAGEKPAARRILETWKRQAETGEFQRPDAEQPETFVRAATAYMRAGGDGTYLTPILKAWPTRLASSIDQIALDTLASELYPNGTPATRNRQVYTPVSAVLKRIGIEKKFKRPIGWQGKKSTSWLEPDQAFALFEAADKLDPEFGLLCKFLIYTGTRLNEALSRELGDLRLDRAYIYLPDSKTGEPRGCHLPPCLIEWFRTQPPRRQPQRNERGWLVGGRPIEDPGVPWLERDPKARLFRYHDGGALRDLLKDSMKAAGLSFPRRQGGFHLCRHTWGAWMRRYGGLDTSGLVATGAWAAPASAARYEHTDASEAAQRADHLPIPSSVVPWKQRAG